MICSKCGAVYAEDARFCSKCNTPLQQASDAPSSPPMSSSKFEGTNAATSAATQMTATPASTGKATSLLQKKTSWRLRLVVIVLLCGGVVLGWRWLTQPKLGATRVNGTDKAEMVGVPGGTFTMGSIKNVGDANEHPAQQVTLSGFWIYKYEVTVAQYRAFCTATKRALPEFPSGLSWNGKTGWDDPALQKHPIVNVSWNDAKAYAAWAGVKLPTEAQWEYAALGTSGKTYPWGGDWDQTKCANYNNSFLAQKSTWPVGSFPTGKSWCGAQDLAGNASECCVDCTLTYSDTPVNNPNDPVTGVYRMLRGGAWYSDRYSSRSAYRFIISGQATRDSSSGFRCVSF